MSNYIYFLTILLCFNIVLLDSLQSILDFRSNPLGFSQKQGLFEVDLGLNSSFRVVAYADVDSDGYTDLITSQKIDQNEKITIFTYSKEQGIFLKFKIDNIAISGTIKNIIVNDFNYDFQFDLLVSYINIRGELKHNLYIQLQNSRSFQIIEILTGVSNDIFVADINGDSIVDIFFTNSTGWYFTFIQQEQLIYNDFTSLISSNCTTPNSGRQLSSLSSAFLDIDGDCKADMFLVTKDKNQNNFVEIFKGYLENGYVKYCQTQEFKLDPSIGDFAFSDFNRNGFVDLIFTIRGTTPKLGISFNSAPSYNSWDDIYCKSQKSGRKIMFNKIDVSTNDNKDQLIISLDNYENYTIYENKDYSIMPIVRIGDVNMDSYPDIIMTLENRKDLSRTTVILGNYQTYINGENSRIFSPLYEVKYRDGMPLYSSFFDLDENGQLDILSVCLGPNNTIYTKSLYNNYVYDAFFMKALTFLEHDSYFSNMFGVDYRYIVTNLDGTRRMDHAVQSPQNSNMRLNLPYAYIGIGRSNNYVENFAIITTIHMKNSSNYNEFTPIIPNSQLIINANFSDGHLNWHLDLIVKPISKLFILIGTIVAIFVVILFFIIYLHFKEIEEDKISETKPFDFWYS